MSGRELRSAITPDPLDRALRIPFLDPDSGKRREAILQAAPPSQLDLRPLDALIDLVIARTRIDPRLRTRESARPKSAPISVRADTAPPPVPTDAGRPKTGPITADAARPKTGPITVDAARPKTGPVAPPPVPNLPPAVPEVPISWPTQGQAPAPLPRPSDELEAATSGRVTTGPISLDTVAHLAEFESRAMTGPIVPALAADAPAIVQLFDDIVILSNMNDRDGLLISLERLLVSAKLAGSIKVFINTNEPKLISLLESQLKSFARVPKRAELDLHNAMPRVFVRGEKIASVLALIDGKLSIQAIAKKNKALSPIETYAALSQLDRTGFIAFNN